MKVFMVFMACTLVFVSFLIYNSDLDYYMQLQNRLKLLAEDTAAACALLTKDESYGQGILAVDERRALEMADYMMEKYMAMPFFQGRRLDYEMEIFDDEKGYAGCENYGFIPGLPCVAVTISCEGSDLFRLSIIDKYKLYRTSVYQWKLP